MKTFYDKYKHIILPAILVVSLVAGVYLFIRFQIIGGDSFKDDKTEIKTAQDSIFILESNVKKLETASDSLEILINIYKQQSNNQIIKETTIKEIYHEKIREVDRYDNDDLVNFFNERYKSDSSITQ